MVSRVRAFSGEVGFRFAAENASAQQARAGFRFRRNGNRSSRIVPWVIGIAVAVAAGQACAQSNLDAGKSPAQIFSDTCNACHRSPRELKQTSPGFLREHYTTGGREAATMAAYLASIGSDARAVQQRRPPALGAGQAAPTETASKPPGTDQAKPPGTDQAKPPSADQAKPPGADQAKPAETQAALPGTTPGRRTPAASEQAKPSPGPAPVATAKPRRPSESMEAGSLSAVTAPGGSAEAVPPQAAAAPSARPGPVEDFEE
jgi:hypothetical protein